jgi:hypothetical protein
MFYKAYSKPPGLFWLHMVVTRTKDFRYLPTATKSSMQPACNQESR